MFTLVMLLWVREESDLGGSGAGAGFSGSVEL